MPDMNQGNFFNCGAMQNIKHIVTILVLKAICKEASKCSVFNFTSINLILKGQCLFDVMHV